MSAQRASAPVRLARLAAAVLLVALAGIVVVRLAGRRGGPLPSAVAPPPADRVVDVKERVRQQEFRDGRPVADIRGTSFFRGPDGRNHLQGSVEIVNLGPAGGTVSRLTADEVVYDPGSLRFAVSGRVRVEAGGVVLEGASFEYDKPAGLFATKSGGRFTSKTITGSAPGIAYAEAADEVRLSDGFQAEFRNAGSEDRIVTLSGESLVYRRPLRRGRVEGSAELRGGRCLATSASLEFVAGPDEGPIESAVFAGAAKIVLFGDAPDGRREGEIAADRVEAAFADGAFTLLSLKAIGRAGFSWPLLPDGDSGVRAPEIVMAFGPSGNLADWRASGGIEARVFEAEGPPRSLKGVSADFDAGTGVLRVRSAPGRPAVADSPAALIESDAIEVDPGGRRFKASGAVRSRLRPEPGAPQAAGLFGAEEVISVSSDSAVIEERGRVVTFSGQVRAWQGSQVVRAGALVFERETGGVQGRDGVEVSLTRPSDPGPAGAEPETVVLGGQDMAYQAASRTLALSGKASVRLPEAGLTAGSVLAVVGLDGRTLESLSARTSVVVSKGRFEGRAEAASYQADVERITLTGGPVLTDGKGGSARGAKLTFDLADDKILIENEGPGRATTVVRS